MKADEHEVLIWDLPVRVGHWLLVGCFAIAWLTSESEEWRLIHVWAGAAMVGGVVFRLIWGVIGSRHARFSAFVQTPEAVVRYLRSLLGRAPQRWVGHNPAGGWAIVLLLALIALTGTSGWLVYQDDAGHWLEEAHELAANTLLAIVLVHLGGVFVSNLFHGENLVRAMVTGRKHAPASDGIASLHSWGVAILLGLVGMCVWWLSR